MPIRVKCGNCKKTLGVKDEHAGKKIKCPVCQNVVTVPSATGQNGTPPSSPEAAPVKKPVGAQKPTVDRNQPAPEVKKPINIAVSNPDLPPPPENAEEEALSVFAEDLAPKQTDEAPKTIDFKCEFCEEIVQLPIEMGGKQTQCPNPECRRIIKVPMPKIEGKKDWRKMDRRGPAGALVSQPEQLENAWGSQDATRARQDSLAKAGALAKPAKPPVGAAGWIMRGFYAVCFVVPVLLMGSGVVKIRNTSERDQAAKAISTLIKEGKINKPVLVAEAHRTLALLYLSMKEGKVLSAEASFSGAQSLIPIDFPQNDPGVNEQLFLADLLLSQCELGSSDPDEEIAKRKFPWERAQEDLKSTLMKFTTPAVQVNATRDLVTRLIEKKQHRIAVGLIASVTPDAGDRSVVSQKVALEYERGDPETVEIAKSFLSKNPASAKELLAEKELTEAHLRGCAEGFARKGEYEEALKLAVLHGTAPDRLETCLAIAAIALNEPNEKNKEEPLKFVKEGLKNAVNPKEHSPWILLQLVKLGARTVEPAAHNFEWDALKNVKERLEGFHTQFKQRAELEFFLARCDQAPGHGSPEDLTDLEESDKEGTTLALAWYALAQQYGRKGVKRSELQRIFAERMRESALKETVQPMVDVGWLLGSLRKTP